MDDALEGSWRRCVEEVGCHVCPESVHGACWLVPMTWLDAMEFYGTFIDVPKEVAMPPQANFRCYGTYDYEEAVDEDIMIVDSILDSMICIF